MNRRDFLKNCLAVSAGCTIGGTVNSVAKGFLSNDSVGIGIKVTGSKTNVLFFFADDQRFSLINALGIEGVITPTMDSFIQDGVCFKNAYIMGGNSAAVCQPSRAMLVSGRDLFNISGSGGTIPTSHKMIQEVLHEKGYNTFVTGKWHNSEAAAARGFTVGKNVFFGGMSNQYNYTVKTLQSNGIWGDIPINNIHSSELFSNTAIEFLESQRNAPEPFFAYIPYKAPHDPRDCPQQYMDMYNLPNGKPDPDKVKLPPNFATVHPNEEEYFDNGELDVRDENLADKPRDPVEVLGEIRDYYGITTHLDAQIGRVMQKLEDIGQKENTIIIFAGDNGLAVGQHALLGKQNVYKHSVGVPLVISGKGVPKGKTVESFCYLFDIFPTICDLVGAQIPDSVKGMSLAPMLKNQNHINRETMYFAYKQYQRAVRELRYKLIEYYVSGQRHTQLFDMQEDPWEQNNLADDYAYRLKRDELRAEMKRLKGVYGDYGSFWNGIEF